MVTEDLSQARDGDAAKPELIERAAELTELGGLLAGAQQDRGRIALIEGAAGIGKTALLSRAEAHAEELGLRVLSARGGELERDFAFGVVRQLLEPLLAAVTDAERERLSAGAARFAAPVLTGFLEMPDAGGTDEPEAVLRGLYWLLANIVRERPALIAVDDAHWVDEPTLRFLTYLARRIAGLEVTLMLAVRSGEAGPGSDLVRVLASEVSPLSIRPAPLSEDGVARLAASRLAGGLPPDLCRRCHRATGGNPFLLTVLLDEIEGDEGRPGEVDPDTLRGFASERIASAVLLRIGRLGPGAPRLARAAAVLGEHTNLGEAANLAGLDREPAARAADSLRRAGILAPDAPLRFIHPIVRTAIYEDIDAGERAALHARAAQSLAIAGAEPEAVALHLLSAEPLGDRAVVERLRDGARSALARGAPEIAARYLRRALEEPTDEEERPVVLLEAGSAATRAGDPDGTQLLREAFELAPGPRARAEAARELGPALMYAGRVGEEIEVFERALDGLEDPELAGPLEALLLLSGLTSIAARPRVRERLREARGRVAELPDRVAAPMLAPIAADVAVTGGSAAEAADLAERALAGGELVRGSMGDSPFGYTAAFILVRAGRPSVAARAMDEAVSEARQRGSVTGLAFALTFRGLAALRLGDLAAAEADARRGAELALEASLGIPLANAASVAISALIERGDLAAARELLERVLDTPHDPDALPSVPLYETIARLNLAEGEPGAAVDALATCLRWERECGARTVVPTGWRSLAALVELARQRPGEARRLAEEEVEVARHFGAARPIGVALRVAGLATEGRAGIELLSEAVSTLEVSEDPLEHARALTDLGAAQRRAGARNDALESLRRGMDLARRCGATVLVEQARDELKVAGARPRRIALTGRESLTPSELRVCDMAAAGMTNPEIAQALFVTQRTVEMHLSNAYRKLEIGSRRELPEALGA